MGMLFVALLGSISLYFFPSNSQIDYEADKNILSMNTLNTMAEMTDNLYTFDKSESFFITSKLDTLQKPKTQNY